MIRGTEYICIIDNGIVYLQLNYEIDLYGFFKYRVYLKDKDIALNQSNEHIYKIMTNDNLSQLRYSYYVYGAPLKTNFNFSDIDSKSRKTVLYNQNNQLIFFITIKNSQLSFYNKS
jgi:hypothetical protein